MVKKTSSKRKKLIIGGPSSPAAEVIASNEDLLTEILLRVPAKSLIRFKCVSKNWRLLISDSHFAFNHARRNRNCSTSGLYFYYDSSSRTVPVKSLSLHRQSSLPTLAFLDGVAGESAKIRIKSSCNGLLLCKCENDLDRTSYVVCNPTTQSYTVLPEIGGFSFVAYLAFDPSKSPHYKVVLVGYNGKIDIYSSEIRSWKHTVVNAPSDRQLEGVFWNGAIHWLLDNNNHRNVHYRFEVDAEKLIRTPVPPRPKILSPEKIRYFGECGGHLILIQMRLVYAVGFRVLEMDKGYCWIVKCRVNLRPLISVFPEIDHSSRSSKFELLSVVKGKNKNAFALVLVIAGKVISCNLKCNTWKLFLDHVPPGYPQGSALLLSHVPHVVDVMYTHYLLYAEFMWTPLGISFSSAVLITTVIG